MGARGARAPGPPPLDPLLKGHGNLIINVCKVEEQIITVKHDGRKESDRHSNWPNFHARCNLLLGTLSMDDHPNINNIQYINNI